MIIGYGGGGGVTATLDSPVGVTMTATLDCPVGCCPRHASRTVTVG